MGRQHFGNVKTSKRLAMVYRELYHRKSMGMTSAELVQRTKSMCIATDVSELRANGFDISCTYSGMSSNKRKVYRYRLEN